MSIYQADHGKVLKVLSLHILRNGQGRYVDGTVDVLSWRRCGRWEDRLLGLCARATGVLH